jgi:preprotein translocase SecE subunit
MRKVTWPTFAEALNSSVVVIVCVVFLMAFLAGADWVLGQWTTRLLTGGRG